MSSRVERLVDYNAPPNGYTFGKVYLWLVLGWPITLSIVMLSGGSLGHGWYRLLWILWSPDTYVYCADLTDMTFILLYLCYLLVLHNFTVYANDFIGLKCIIRWHQICVYEMILQYVWNNVAKIDYGILLYLCHLVVFNNFTDFANDFIGLKGIIRGHPICVYEMILEYV